MNWDFSYTHKHHVTRFNKFGQWTPSVADKCFLVALLVVSKWNPLFFITTVNKRNNSTENDSRHEVVAACFRRLLQSVINTGTAYRLRDSASCNTAYSKTYY